MSRLYAVVPPGAFLRVRATYPGDRAGILSLSGCGVVMAGSTQWTGLQLPPGFPRKSLFFCAIALFASAAILPGSVKGQTPDAGKPSGQSTTATPTKPAEQKPELSENTTELKTGSPNALKVRVNLVLVRVVVRDEKGRPVGALHEEDFQLLDNKKQQIISHFAVETPGTQLSKAVKPDNASGSSETGDDKAAPIDMPQRFVAYLFDDVHLAFDDIVRSRDAADHQISTEFKLGDRAGIFTSSGQTVLDFTDDRAKLHETLQRLRPHPIGTSGIQECPDVSYYQADLMENKHDQQASETATYDALACAFGNDPRMLAAAQQMAESMAVRVLNAGDTQTQYSLRLLEDLVRRISVLPGQRNLILISPGFLFPGHENQVSEIVDRALRSSVVVNAVDARGLYTIDPAGDISQPGGFSSLMGAAGGGRRATYLIGQASAQQQVMAELADGTGGTFFHNSNDLDDGFRRVAAAPEVFYVLGFSPQNLKFDGHYHTLKVTLTGRQKLSVQARKGYVAPKHMADPLEQAKQEIEEAIFSQDEVHDLPVDLHTQFFKTTDAGAKLTVLTHVDLSRIHFRKEEGRNRNNLTVVAALFDRNGNLVTGTEKVVEMRLLDATLARMGQRGITVRTSFDVKPGGYLVRLVVRDSEAELLTAQNGAVEIPY